MRSDLYTKAVLTAIALLLATLALRPTFHAVPVVRADSDTPNFYIDPAVVTIRKTDGSSLGDGRLVIDRRTGDAWGFPTLQLGAPYPINVRDSTPPTSKPIYLGRFDFSAMKQNP